MDYGRLGFFFGCTASLIRRDVFEATEKVLEAAGLDYEVMGVERCCGMPLILPGYMDEARVWALENVEEMKRRGLSTLVTGCPSCYRSFTHFYPDKLGVEVPFKVLHFTQLVDKLIEDERLKPRGEVAMRVAYHDPCELGRMSHIYEEPRRILSAIPGLVVKEVRLNRELSACCGNGGLVRSVFPTVSVKVGLEKLEMEVVPLEVDAVVSACPFCHINLEEASKMGDIGLRVYDISQVLAMSLEE